MLNRVLILLLLFMTPMLSHCTGSECSATDDFINDTDSDCVNDSSDNCVGYYNPNQLDSNDDGVGDACTLSSSESASLNGVELTNLPEFGMVGYLNPVDSDLESAPYSLQDTDCTISIKRVYVSSQGIDFSVSSDTNNENKLTDSNWDCDHVEWAATQRLICEDQISNCIQVYDAE
ncbi:MAG: hypothetical protein H7A33_02195 [Deltaproteobacteria bacterium]|nr:hypothetical protein [Deltaproteobacteria bacterium]